MFDSETLLWCVPLLPLLGAIGCALMGTPRLRKLSHVPCVVGAVAFVAVTILLLISVPNDTALSSSDLTWFAIGGVNVKATLVIDPLASVMLLAITFIGTWIAIFSIGYMHGDEGYARYFSIVSLFLFSMTLLVLADNFILLFAGWEGVGLCSYLLIGYWYAKPSAAAAARKAFLVTRLGDVGLVLGLFLLWSITRHSLNFQSIFFDQNALERNHGTLVVACLLILCGAIGKSAQFPLYVWLPDAMEGPTPVSALIHAATMVTAGVYLIARCMPIFVLCPGVQVTIACIGAFTALLAAYIALTQHDLKRVLAYSTISQIGYMFLAAGLRRTSARRGGSVGRDFPLVYARVLQGGAVPVGRQCDAWHGQRHRHAKVRRAAQTDAGNAHHVPVRRRGTRWFAIVVGVLEQRCYPRRHLRSGRLGVILRDDLHRSACRRLVDRVADGLLHLPGLFPDVLGHDQGPGRSRRPPARVAVGDDRAANRAGDRRTFRWNRGRAIHALVQRIPR